MAQDNYLKMYNKIFNILGDLTPLKADCGHLCNSACCKGDHNIGMRLFPFEETGLSVKECDNATRLAICNGNCNRKERPLACRIFPFFPTIDEKNKIYVELDYRAFHLCPMIEHSDEIIFNKRFINAVKKIGKILSKDTKCRDFLKESTEEIDTYYLFLHNK